MSHLNITTQIRHHELNNHIHITNPMSHLNITTQIRHHELNGHIHITNPISHRITNSMSHRNITTSNETSAIHKLNESSKYHEPNESVKHHTTQIRHELNEASAYDELNESSKHHQLQPDVCNSQTQRVLYISPRCASRHITSSLTHTHYITSMCKSASRHMGWRWLVGSIKLWVSFAKEPYKRDYILQKRLIILSILLTAATP